MELVYIVQEVNRRTGELGDIKVGKSTERQLEYRLRNLQTGNPRLLFIRYTKLWPHAFDLENNVHEKFHANRVSEDSEWFTELDWNEVVTYILEQTREEPSTDLSSEDLLADVRVTVIEPSSTRY